MTYPDDVVEKAQKAFDEYMIKAFEQTRCTSWPLDQKAVRDGAWQAALAAAEAAMWRPMNEARKDRTPVLLRFKNPIPDDRDHVRSFDGLTFVGRHPGVEDDGFDVGWNFAAPVGMGGFPDEWFEGWRPTPPAASTGRG